MAGAESLKRLGGGRWASKDGRFTIEPESGTWVIVDNEQSDELGLPLVRGPFPSLSAARTAIEEGREAGPVESPLAERLERARRDPPSKAKAAPSRRKPEPAAEPDAKAPEPPPEPAWLRRLDEPARARVRDIVARLERAGVADPQQVARAEVADDRPALARLALERRLRAAAQEAEPLDAVWATIRAVLAGADDELGAQWRLVDGAGRPIGELDVAGAATRRSRPSRR